mmetsp:Transcript_41377/g.103275  ORF Transcript_41377/g.103275 Transcript_41377/m.103275 type:complete len:269 (-) Transcript_41377:477-1283(-)
MPLSPPFLSPAGSRGVMPSTRRSWSLGSPIFLPLPTRGGPPSRVWLKGDARRMSSPHDSGGIVGRHSRPDGVAFHAWDSLAGNRRANCDLYAISRCLGEKNESYVRRKSSSSDEAASSRADAGEDARCRLRHSRERSVAGPACMTAGRGGGSVSVCWMYSCKGLRTLLFQSSVRDTRFLWMCSRCSRSNLPTSTVAGVLRLSAFMLSSKARASLCFRLSMSLRIFWWSVSRNSSILRKVSILRSLWAASRDSLDTPVPCDGGLAENGV